VEYAISTNQLDFLASRRLGLTYKGPDGQDHPVYVIHRAPLGSHERFVGFLLEHYKGAFPLWLAPVQASRPDRAVFAPRAATISRHSGLKFQPHAPHSCVV
jgi:hypothetical protein